MKLAHALVACLGGAGLSLYAATRVWSVEVTPRPGLSDLRSSITGAAAQPWLIALAVVALAGTGAVLATRGVVRRGLGGLLVLVGLGVAVAAVSARADLGGGASLAGPIACVVGGALIVWGGVGAARHGHEWPVMGARYERRAVPSLDATLGAGSEPSAAAGLSAGGELSVPPAPATPSGPSVPPAPPAAGGPFVSASPGTPGGPTVSAGPAAAGGSDASGGLVTPGGTSASAGSGDAAVPGEPKPADNRAFWDALDRGDDPTAR